MLLQTWLGRTIPSSGSGVRFSLDCSILLRGTVFFWLGTIDGNSEQAIWFHAHCVKNHETGILFFDCPLRDFRVRVKFHTM